ATNDSFVDRNAAFGPRIPPDGIVLNLIAVESLDVDQETTACRPVAGAPANTSWAALVERGGDCSFVEKVRHMQASGAKAVIVGDNQNNGLITMYAREDTSDVLIPSVFIAQRHYRELRYLGIEYCEDFLIRMTPDDLNWPLLDVVVFIILSPAFVVFFLYFIWRVRVRQQQIADLAPTEVVTNLPIKVFYSAKLKENDPVECVICLEDFEDEAELRVLPCRHEYHVACIDNWLTTRKKFCPICKRDICTATESTPLLASGGSGSRSNRSFGNNDTRRASYRASLSTNIPPSSTSSGASSSSAPAPTSTGPIIASSWPLSLQRQSERVAAAARGISSMVGGAASTTNTAVAQEAISPRENQTTEEEVLRRV
ncbi:hypothetical protein BGX21_001167, partial [Mortierella sp. AD011]